MKRKLPFIIIIGALGITLTAAWYWNRSANRTSLSVSQNGRSRSGPVREGAKPAHALGPADAPVMLEEFGDFQCASCASLHETLDDLKESVGPRVTLVFRQFPLVNAHPNAMFAARVAEAAALQGKFWEMHDLLFEKQKEWRDLSDPSPRFQEYAVNIGLDVNKFQADLSNQALNERILLDRERGRWIGINSTPTLFLNGREVAPESMSPPKLRQLVEAEIAATGGKK